MTETKQGTSSNPELVTQELRELQGKTDYEIEPLIQLMDVYREKPNFVVPLLLTNLLVINENTKTFYTTMSYENGRSVLNATTESLQPDLKKELDRLVKIYARSLINSLKSGKYLQVCDFAEELLFGKLGKILSDQYPEVRKTIRQSFHKGDQSFENSLKGAKDIESKQEWRLDFRVAQLFGKILGIKDAMSVLPVSPDRARKEELKKDEEGQKRRSNIRKLSNVLGIQEAVVEKGILGNIKLSFKPLNNKSNKEDIRRLARLIVEDFSVFYLQRFDITAGFVEGDLPSDIHRGSDVLFTVFDNYTNVSARVASLSTDPLGKSLELEIPSPSETKIAFQRSGFQSLHEPTGGKIETLTIEEQVNLLSKYSDRLSLSR